MKSIESSGKTVKDAINQGAKELGCDPSDLEIEVLEMGSPGLFGMFGRLARVKLTLKEAEDEFEIDIPEMTLDQPAQKAARSHRREEKPKATRPPRRRRAQEQPAEKENVLAAPASAPARSARGGRSGRGGNRRRPARAGSPVRRDRL